MKKRYQYYFEISDIEEAKTLLEKREDMSELMNTALKNEIERRKKEKELSH